MSDIRWEGFSHQEIYDAVHRGPGREVSTAAELAWAETEALILRVDQRIAAAMAGSAPGWEGAAADTTRTAMTPLGRWALDAANDAKITAQAVTAQGEQARELRVTMPEPVTAQREAEMAEAHSDPLYIFHGLDDLHAVEQDGANRNARAVELMNTYTHNSHENRRNMDYWTFPPQVTVVTGVAGAPGPSAGPGGAGFPEASGPAGPAPGTVAAQTTAQAATQTPTGVPGPAGGPVPVPAAGPGAPVPAPGTVSPGAPGGAPAGPGGAPGAPAGVPIIAPGGVAPAVIGPGRGRDGGGAAPAARPSAPPPAGPAPGTAPVTGPTARPGGAAPAAGPGRPAGVPSPHPAPPGGVRPVVPVAPPRPGPLPGWRDVVPGGAASREPAGRLPVGGGDPERALPPQGGGRGTAEVPGRVGPPGERAAAAATEPGTRASAPRPPVTGHTGGLYPPLAAGAGAAAGQGQERRRPDYLLDDSDAFADDRWFPPPVITPDDGPPTRR